MKELDPNWIEKIKQKDQRTMTLLYNNNREIVYKTIYAMTKSTELSEDLTNDTFIKIYEEIERYRTDTSFIGWIKVVATNLTIDYFRKSTTKLTDYSIDDTTTTDNVNADVKNPDTGSNIPFVIIGAGTILVIVFYEIATKNKKIHKI